MQREKSRGWVGRQLDQKGRLGPDCEGLTRHIRGLDFVLVLWKMEGVFLKKGAS